MTDHAELLVRYRRLREVGLVVNNILVKRLNKDILGEGGRNLGILKKGVLVFDSEDETSVLMDYCIHDVRRQGRNVVEQYLTEAPFPPESDEMAFLRAKKDAYYSLFLVEEVEPGVGVLLRDALRGGTKFIMDIGFSRSAAPGVVLAARIMSTENISMTTGASLPLVQIPENARQAWLQKVAGQMKTVSFDQVSPESASERTTAIIRSCLAQGAATRVIYEDPSRGPSRGPRPESPKLAARIGRNDPCSCGSGKKFKKCCGARR